MVIEFDSEYAAGIVRRSLAPKENLRLAIACRAALDDVTATIIWWGALAHTGLALNERADRLAKCGARQISRGMSAGWCTLPDALDQMHFS